MRAEGRQAIDVGEPQRSREPRDEAVSPAGVNEGGQIRFILLKPLGAPLITTVPQDVLLATLQACTAR